MTDSRRNKSGSTVTTPKPTASSDNDPPRNDDGFLDLHYSMLRVRRVEERLLEVFAAGKIPGFIHVSIGQEAVATGICSCLTPKDTIFTTHRGHGHPRQWYLHSGQEIRRTHFRAVGGSRG